MKLSCREASRLISDSQDRSLSAYERVSLRLHLFLCRNCRHFAGQLKVMRQGIREGRQK